MKKALAIAGALVLAVTPAASFACDLSGTRMTNANLSGTDLKRAILKDTDLRGVNLIDANLSGADLHYSNLTGANLTNADVSGANFGPAENDVRAYVKSCPSSLPNNNWVCEKYFSPGSKVSSSYWIRLLN